MIKFGNVFRTVLCLLFVVASTEAYAQRAIDSIEKLINTAVSKDKVKHIYKLNRLCQDAGQYDKSFKYSKQALDIAIKEKKVSWQADFYNEFGICYEARMVNDSALKNYLKAYGLFESDHNKVGEAMVLDNIGNIYRKERNYEKALEYIIKALAIRRESDNKEGIAFSETTLGSYYYDVYKLDSALYYYQSALRSFTVLKNKSHIASVKNNIGSIYNELNRHQEAIVNYREALALYEELRDTLNVTMCLANLGNVYNVSGNPTKGIEYSLNALKKARAINARSLIAPIYVFLIEGSQKLGDDKKVIQYQAELINYKDTLYDSQTNENMASMQTKFDTDKKEKENQILKQQNELQRLNINQQKIINYSVIGGLLLVIVLAFYMYKGYQQKKKANVLLEEKNGLIEEKNKIVEEKQKEIIDSINYAKRIQYTLLAHDEFLKNNLSQAGAGHFVLFNPKDIVSGDFYWATKHENKFYLAVCDSTGHGVPGAFMSLLSIGYLSEAINEKNIEQPNEVFNYVRRRLVDTISKDGQKDGFDGILICLDIATKIVTYAAANNKPILVRNNELLVQDHDRMPVGISDQQQYFKLYRMDVQEGDVVYLYTDGYADQFGGPKGKKFKYKTLNDLLVANHQRTLQEQKDLLQQAFSEWRGSLEQVDDVCVVGLKF